MNNPLVISATLERVNRGLPRRYAAERRLRAYGLLALLLGLGFLELLLGNILTHGISAFFQTQIRLDIEFSSQVLDPAGMRDPVSLGQADYDVLIKDALKRNFPEVTDRQARRKLYGLISNGAAFELRRQLLANHQLIDTHQSLWLAASAEIDLLIKGVYDRAEPEVTRRVNDQEIAWIDQLAAQGAIRHAFNTDFFVGGDSRHPEQAGIGGALVGSFYTLFLTLCLSFPIGVLAAIYLEELAPCNRFTDLIEVNINNLAAVPSIVFGLLGLAVFINIFSLPRSAPLVGGLVLTLMTLPTIIIASRAALKSVPPSVREAALGVGASPLQTIFHHVLPLALPGMLTGAILGAARALGESAPLLMIGMVAFIVDIPSSLLDPATVLPVQIYLWADSPERGFVEKTAAAILVLLLFLLLMNAIAVMLRKRYERRW